MQLDPNATTKAEQELISDNLCKQSEFRSGPTLLSMIRAKTHGRYGQSLHMLLSNLYHHLSTVCQSMLIDLSFSHTSGCHYMHLYFLSILCIRFYLSLSIGFPLYLQTSLTCKLLLYPVMLAMALSLCMF